MTADRLPTADRLAAIAERKRSGTPIVMLTAYDHASALAADAAGVDIVLVGDSLATTSLGLASTRDVTLDEMLTFARAVGRAVLSALVVGDMPFGTYEASDALAVATARRFVDAGCDAVKMEGGGDTVARAAAVIAGGIPVMGHIGLAPQQLGAGDAPRVQGRSAEAALRLVDDGLQLQRAGCFAIVIEAVPAAVTERIAPLFQAPLIGIGAGSAAHGQVLVTYDLLGLTSGRVPKFVKPYAHLREAMEDAMTRFASDVRARSFPEETLAYAVPAEELEALERAIAGRRR